MITRFWAAVKLTDAALGRVRFDDSGCWLWTGRVSRTGYGQWHRDGKPVSAHRFVYQEVRGPIAEGLTLDHLCRVRICVNPDHLEPVTIQENLKRRDTSYLVARWDAFRDEQTHCPSGHEMSVPNTYHRPDGARICRECRRASQRVAKENARARRAQSRKVKPDDAQ